jgi:FixJ family two-component response regulator
MRRVVFVDDDEDLLEVFREVLGYSGLASCVVARSLAELVQQRDLVLASNLAIIDVNLGQDLPSGVDVFRWLKSERFAGDIVFLTGHAADHPLVIAAAQVGARGIFNKPIEMEELARLVKSP